MVQRNGGEYYTNEMFREAQIAMKKTEADLRIVLVGKTRVGKTSFSTVTSECQKETRLFEGQKLAVVDTPGLYETKLTQKEVKREIVRCISFAAPGPHVFLVKIFGEKAADYTMALVIHEDDVTKDTIEQRFPKCGARYHVLNSRNKDPSEVRELLEKINTMNERNGGCCYTTNMFEEAEKAIKKEMERLQKENPELTAKEARYKAERMNIIAGADTGVNVGAAAGAGVAAGIGAGIGIKVAVGASVGAIGGPVGAAVGVLVGALVGLAAGLKVKSVTSKRKLNDCVTQ
uniref:AIG1-type G domain-containing protein n=1 Tax=Oreochromis aureus TaxID=47969 RepID=A0AAZ1Y4N2_OREAU